PSKFSRLSAMAWVLCLAACAARPVSPIAMRQSGDEQLSCADLAQQRSANRAAAEQLFRDDRDVESNNVAKNVVGGLLGPVGLLLAGSSDLSNEEQVKARALIDRNDHLVYLARKKACGEQ